MTTAPARLAPPSGLTRLTGLAPGLCLTAAIAALAYALRLIPGVATLSPMIVAVILGALAHNLIGAPRAARSEGGRRLFAALHPAPRHRPARLADHRPTGGRPRRRGSGDDRRCARLDLGLHHRRRPAFGGAARSCSPPRRRHA